jgi:hypothetical protein
MSFTSVVSDLRCVPVAGRSERQPLSLFTKVDDIGNAYQNLKIGIVEHKVSASLAVLCRLGKVMITVSITLLCWRCNSRLNVLKNQNQTFVHKVGNNLVTLQLNTLPGVNSTGATPI